MDWQIIACIVLTITQITTCLITGIPPKSAPDSNYSSHDIEDTWWTQVNQSLSNTIRNCLSLMSVSSSKPRSVQIRNQIAMLSACLKYYMRNAMKAVLSDDVIPVVEGVDLVKINLSEERRTSRIRADGGKREVDAGDTSVTGWRNMLIDTLADIFDTHAIRISMHELQVAEVNTETARRRKRQQQMMPLMMFGLMGLALILVPMGFQFLAVLGGKALLLAKMALILTSIQGLKKVAHSNLNYGLYHSAPASPWYDRKAAEDTEHPYRMDDTYYYHYNSPYPEHAVDHKRYVYP